MNTELESLENLEYNAQSRLQLVSEPLPCLPHKCAVCSRGYSNDSSKPIQFLDWNLEVEFFGKVYICTDCLREACNQMGYADPEQVKRLVDSTRAKSQEIVRLAQENAELKNALASLNNVFGTSVAVSESDVPDDDETLEEDDGDDVNADDITLGDSTGEEGSTEQIDESGSSDVPVDESYRDFTEFI